MSSKGLQTAPRIYWRYVMATVSVGLALWVNLLLDPVLGNYSTFPTFFIAIVFSAWYGGLGPGLLSMILGYFAAAYFFVPQPYAFAITKTASWVGLALYVVTGSAVLLLGHLQRSAQRRAEASALEALSRNQELEREIDRRRKAENALRLSEERFRVALENSPIVVFAQDKDLRYAWVYNPKLGYSAEEVLGKTDRDLLAAEDASRLEEIKRRVLETGCGAREEVGVRANEQDGFFDLTVEPLGDSSGQIVGITCAATDITESKRAAEALRQSEERFSAFMRHLPGAAFIKDCEGRYVYANETCAALLGAKRGEWRGKTDSQLFPPATAAHLKETDLQVFKSGQALQVVDTIAQDGDVRDWLVTKFPILDEHRTPNLLGGIRIDITDQRRAEIALRESEARFQAFMDNIPAAAFMKDGEGRYVYGNRTEARALGTSLEGFRGKTDFDLFPHDIAQRLRENDARVLATGRPIETTETAPTADRSSSRWLVLKFPFTDAHGRRCVGGVAVDITEHERAEQALRESEEKLNSILGSLNDVVWSLSAKGHDLVYLNAAAERIYGHKVREFFEDRDLWLKVIHRDDRERVLGSLSELLDKGSCELEYRIVRPDGEVRWVRDRGRIIYGGDREMLRLDGIVTDITEKVRAETELIESRRRLKALFENTQDAILFFDDEGRVVDVNPAACALFGYDPEPFLQLTVWDLLPLPDRQASRERWRAFMPAGGSSGGGYKTIVRSDRTTRLVERRAVANIVPGLHFSVLRDVTERQQAEEALRDGAFRLRGLAAHLESVREEQSARIAREVHDELGGTLTMLKLGLASVLDKIQESDALRQKLASMLELIDGVIQGVKRISTSLRPIMLDTLGLTATIKWHVNEFSALTGIRNELRMPEYIRLSPKRSTAVFRIIQETLTNVARHAEATKVTIRLSKHKGRLLVEITDNGNGITDEALSKPESFGILGMRERSQFLGGELNVQGVPNQGTKLTLSLPLEL
jgi:PAS domain S-box-containing protein